MNNKKGFKVKCHLCGYRWVTKSKLIMVGCPSCNRKTKIRDKLIK